MERWREVSPHIRDILELMTEILGILLIVVVILAVARDRQTKRECAAKSNEVESGRRQSTYKYRRKSSIMTVPEAKFFRILRSAVGKQYFIFPQVHLSAILDHTTKGQNWPGAFAHINGKSVDYVLCEPKGLAPVAAIELDDNSHNTEDRQLRDVEVERVLASAGLPLLRYKLHQLPTPEVIADDVARNAKL